jgi:hypothetical protein
MAKKGIGARRVRRFEPSGSRDVDVELRRTGEHLDRAEDRSGKAHVSNCRLALTGLLDAAMEVGVGEESGDEHARSEAAAFDMEMHAINRLANRFMRVCAKASAAQRRAGQPYSHDMAGLGGFEDALPAGGPVFEDDGDDIAERPGRGLRKANKDGRGNNCVYDRDGKLVRCFAKMETAREVARGFGSGFLAKKRRG